MVPAAMQRSAQIGQQQLDVSPPLTGFGRLLDQPGKTGPERLAAFERLPEPAQALAWRGLRRDIEHERSEAER